MVLQLGRYETVRPIASGGMATVHLARATGAGGFERLVAVKVMHPHIVEEGEFVDMFLDEARLAARVRHPNVVATIDVSEDPLFLVMEYVEGASLDRVTARLRKTKADLPLDVALRVFLDMLAGLHAAHELIGPDGAALHLIHRDVSPQNLLVGVDGIARITDFGIAHAESRLTTTRGGQMKGKVAYMAPEQLLSEPIDRRCDIYAAGVVLWELLAQQRLFRADSEGALLRLVLEGNVKPPSAVVSRAPALDAVTMRALSREAAARYATAADFADALEEVSRAAGLSIATPRAVSAFMRGLDLKDPGESPFFSTATPTGKKGASKAASTPAPIDALPQEGSLRDPLSREGSLRDPLSHEGSLRDPLSHEGSLRDPLFREGSLRDPLSREGSLRDPLSREGSLRDPLSHEGSLRDPLLAPPAQIAPVSDAPGAVPTNTAIISGAEVIPPRRRGVWIAVGAVAVVGAIVWTVIGAVGDDGSSTPAASPPPTAPATTVSAPAPEPMPVPIQDPAPSAEPSAAPTASAASHAHPASSWAKPKPGRGRLPSGAPTSFRPSDL